MTLIQFLYYCKGSDMMSLQTACFLCLLSIVDGHFQKFVTNQSKTCQLTWDEKISSKSGGVQYRACCGMKKVTFQPFKNPSKLQLVDTPPMSVDFPLDNPRNEKPLYFYICPDGQNNPRVQMADSIEKVCEEKEAQVVDISKDSRIMFDTWYRICYYGYDGCQLCFIDSICKLGENKNCFTLNVTHSVIAIREDSMKYLVQFSNDFPFNETAEIDITVLNYWDKLSQTHKIKSINGQKQIVKFTNLDPSSWYYIITCLHINPNSSNKHPIYHKKPLCREFIHRTRPITETASNLNYDIVFLIVFTLQMILIN